MKAKSAQNYSFSLALTLAMVLVAATPALAEKLEDEVNLNDYRIVTTPDTEATSKSAKQPIEPAKEVAQTTLKHRSGLGFLAAPKAVGGVLMGMTVGVPVRIARDISHETLRMRDQMTDDVSGGDRPDLFARTVGSYSGMAYGVVSGVIKGSIKGTERAIDCGARKPFSKESLSLQDPN